MKKEKRYIPDLREDQPELGKKKIWSVTAFNPLYPGIFYIQ